MKQIRKSQPGNTGQKVIDPHGDLRKMLMARLDYDLMPWSDRRNISLAGGPGEARLRVQRARSIEPHIPTA